MEFPSDAAFLRHNPRIVLLRQSGNLNNMHGNDNRMRQKIKRYAYTRKLIDDNKQLPYYDFIFPSLEHDPDRPDVLRAGNNFQFCLYDAFNDEMFTPDVYFNHFGETRTDSASGVIFKTIKRGGIKGRHVTYHPTNGKIGTGYASSMLGFQLITDAGKSNIVYVKFKLIVLKPVQAGGQYYTVATWSIV
jgi:hypothetical protein